jgi:hypothetical protein
MEKKIEKHRTIFNLSARILFILRELSRNRFPGTCHRFYACAHRNKPDLIQINVSSLTFTVTIKRPANPLYRKQLFGWQDDIPFDVQQYIYIYIYIYIYMYVRVFKNNLMEWHMQIIQILISVFMWLLPCWLCHRFNISLSCCTINTASTDVRKLQKDGPWCTNVSQI